MFPLLALGVAAVLSSSAGRAANPITSDVFTADPTALVHNGVVYVYTGHDEAALNDNNYRMKEWLCFSTNDMVHWRAHGPVLKLTDFTWAQSDAWAGDVVERNGKFYYYVPVYNRVGAGFSIGVAVADSPLGPFTDARGSAIITNDMTPDLTIFWDDIDPKVFIDDDGQAYLFWGNTRCRYVKLKPNMIETDGDIMATTPRQFTEATWVHKHAGRYYLSYASQFPETLSYATSDKITGPWTYRGMFKNLARNCNTNHHAIIEFKGRSYIVYHNGMLPGGGDYRRSVCVDYLNYNADGTIQMVTETDAGVQPAPVVSVPGPTSTVSLGGPAALTATATGVGPLTYQWSRNGVPVAGGTAATLAFSSVTAADLGTYVVTVSDAIGGVATASADLATGTFGRLINLSLRSQAGTGSDALIVGFVLGGNANKPVMIRGVGPTLTAFNVTGVLPDPKLDLYLGQTVIATNDTWTTSADAVAIRAGGGDQIAGVPLNPNDAVLLQMLAPNAYTAQVSGVGSATGIALVEVYDMDTTDPASPAFAGQPRLLNVSARTQVGTGDAVLVAGFIINGTLPKRVMIRGIGPTLAGFGVSGALADPDLALYASSTLLLHNETWASSPRVDEVYAAGGEKLGTTVLNPREAVIIATLAPGGYTAQLRGANGTTGVGLLEVYELP